MDMEPEPGGDPAHGGGPRRLKTYSEYKVLQQQMQHEEENEKIATRRPHQESEEEGNTRKKGKTIKNTITDDTNSTVDITENIQAAGTSGLQNKDQVQQNLESNPRTVQPPTPRRICIKFLGEAYRANLAYDQATVHALLNYRGSPFKDSYEGNGKFRASKHELEFIIKNKKWIQDLTQITELWDPYNKKYWSIKCEEPDPEPIFTYGVVKIQPKVPEDRIEQELFRNIDIHHDKNINIEEIFRIKKWNRDGGPKLNTWSVRLKFTGPQKPEFIKYGGNDLRVSPYIPDVTLCSKCSKAGHIAKYCKSSQRCGRCSGHHPKWECRIHVDNHEQKKCPNCNEKHSAGYGKCKYLQVNRETEKIHAHHPDIPRSEIRKNLWSKVVSGETTPENETEENMETIEQSQTAPPPSQQLQLTNTDDSFPRITNNPRHRVNQDSFPRTTNNPRHRVNHKQQLPTAKEVIDLKKSMTQIMETLLELIKEAKDSDSKTYKESLASTLAQITTAIVPAFNNVVIHVIEDTDESPESATTHFKVAPNREAHSPQGEVPTGTVQTQKTAVTVQTVTGERLGGEPTLTAETGPQAALPGSPNMQEHP